MAFYQAIADSEKLRTGGTFREIHIAASGAGDKVDKVSHKETRVPAACGETKCRKPLPAANRDRTSPSQLRSPSDLPDCEEGQVQCSPRYRVARSYRSALIAGIVRHHERHDARRHECQQYW